MTERPPLTHYLFGGSGKTDACCDGDRAPELDRAPRDVALKRVFAIDLSLCRIAAAGCALLPGAAYRRHGCARVSTETRGRHTGRLAQQQGPPEGVLLPA